MGVLKNDVGRPSNKTIIIRNILKGICSIIIISLVIFAGYCLKGNKNYKNNISVTTISSIDPKEKFDLSKITTKCVDIECNGIYIYAYGKRIESDVPYFSILRKDAINDVAVIEIGVIADANSMIIVNKAAEVLYNTENQEDIKDLYFESNKDYYEEFYGYKIDNDVIRFTMGAIGQDVNYTVCNLDQSEIVYSEYEMKYKNKKISKPKKLSSMTASEFILKHNIDCSQIK